jgi:two-component system response regulator YesN
LQQTDLYNELFFDEKIEEKLINNLKSCKQSDAEILLEQTFKEISLKRPNFSELSKFVKKLSYEVFICVEKAKLTDQIFIENYENLQNLEHYYSMQEIVESIKQLISYTIKLFEKIRETRYNRIIESTIQYINENYSLDISINDLADLSGINANYLCSLFKNETNMTMVEYITFIRLEKAKEMLQKSQDKLSDISQAIGYKDVKYFIRIFKKNIGITPNDFRKYSTI